MDINANCPLAATLAERLRQSRDELTHRWLERITDRVRLHPNRVFPTEDLLDHVPILMLGIADYIEDPVRVVSSESAVVAKAMELGELRFAQGFDEHELLKEYELFGGILYAFLSRTADSIDQPCTRGELLTCAHRLFHAISIIQQATTTQFVARMKERIKEREERLRAFNRTLTHELKNRIGAALGAAQILDDIPNLAPDERRRLSGVVLRNVGSMQGVLDNLAELSRLGTVDARHQRHITLPDAAAEAARQLRDAARSEGVEIRLAALPPIEVNAAAVELCLANLISNAIKYSDRAKPVRWVQIDAAMRPEEGATGEIVVQVRDNGIGLTGVSSDRIFDRYVRAHESSRPDVEGSGLGLSIVRETVQSLGGRAWAEPTDEGSMFAFSLPCRREQDSKAVALTDAAGQSRG